VSEPSCLAAVRKSYDTVADAYAEQVPRPPDLDPLPRTLLGMFAETVRDTNLGPLADLGCGPGFVTAHLAGLGAPAFGVDLSPRMVELARRAHPHLTARTPRPLRRVPPHPRTRCRFVTLLARKLADVQAE
jgi:SAM-dependent methyltransferase